ncbi:hypothetical protein SLS55_010344 [Diplodia seriata]|uniref:Uncharacterized protein n=1 Tax=Diplodia seriata TaxID=420778 RepID=A0ABR3BY86_9PEZI
MFWDCLSRKEPNNPDTTQGASNLSGSGTTTISYFLSIHPKNETHDKGSCSYSEETNRAPHQKEDAGDVQSGQGNVDDTDKADDDVEGSRKWGEDGVDAEVDDAEVENPEDVEDDDIVRDWGVEENVEDFGELEENDAYQLAHVERGEETGNVQTVAKRVEEIHISGEHEERDVEKDEEETEDTEENIRDVKGDVEISVDEEVEEFAEGDEKEFAKVSSAENPTEKRERPGVRVHDFGRTETRIADDMADEVGQSHQTEDVSTQNQSAESSVDGDPHAESVHDTTAGTEKNILQLIPISEDVRRILSQMATSTHYRPRRTAMGTKNFTNYVLSPRGIQIDTDEPKPASAFEHFNTAEPTPGSDLCEHYRHRNGLRSSTVWINPTAAVIQAIHNNYSEMHQSVPNALCEPEWVDDAVKYLLKSEPRSRLQHKPCNPPQWLPVRMREESFRPQDGGVWEMPPIVHGDMPVDPTFNFNVQPDCSYWIWAGGFRPEINGKLDSLASVRYRRSLCPYLTIEVKKDAKNSGKGRQQIATAASTALYNRWKLKERYLRETGSSFSKARLSDVRHYGLLLAGVRYEVWSLRPHSHMNYSTNSWTGCSMRRIHSGDLDTTTGIKEYVHWINEIHCWGNTRHSSDCVRDIESRLLPEGKALATTLAQLALVKMGDL